jgi:kinase suppressor of Ras 2
VWYELLCGEWPFKAQPPEAIIWQVGVGMKQSLANLQASRDVKVRSYGFMFTNFVFVGTIL